MLTLTFLDGLGNICRAQYPDKFTDDELAEMLASLEEKE